MNESTLTICGNVVAEPRHIVTDDGLPITSFRIASTVRRFDRGERQWVDGETAFLTVTCFRGMAVNVADSIKKGEKVMVHGRLRVRQWQNDGKSGTSVELDAYAVGHDLSWGRSRFQRVVRTERIEPPGRTEADELADSFDDEYTDDDVPEGSVVDRATGEIRQEPQPVAV